MEHTQNATKPWSFDSNWLSGKVFDNLFIFGVLGIAVFSGLIVWNEPGLFGPVLFLDLWFLGYHHVISTFTKLAGTAEDRRENRFLIYYLPFIVAGAVAAIGFGVGIWAIVTIYFFWQWFHYTRQSYGISAFYRRKAAHPIKDSAWLSQATLWSIPVWGILLRCEQGWNLFLYQSLWVPNVPYFLVVIAAIVSIGLVGYWLVQRFIDLRNGTLAMGHTLFMISHFSAFYVGYILIPNIDIGWLVANIWHNAQYILFVWLYNTKRFGNSNESDKTILSWVCQTGPVRILAYFFGCLLITTVVYKGILTGYDLAFRENAALLTTLYVVTFQAINFHHYIVDGLIWKARKKKHQKVMYGHAAVPRHTDDASKKPSPVKK